MADPAELIDYTTMKTAAMLGELGDNAAKWAAAFCQHAKKIDGHAPDEGWMIGWFANAIEHSHSIRTRVAALTPPATPTQGASAEDAAVLDAYADALTCDAKSRYDNPSEMVDAIARQVSTRAACLARMAGKVPDGWKLVPVEPTMKMMQAVADADALAPTRTSGNPFALFKTLWRAAWMAAPEASR